MITTLNYASSEFADRLLRTKADTAAADPAWAVEQLDPNTVRITITNADAGDWSFEIEPVDGATWPDGSDVEAPDPIVFEAAAEDEDTTEDVIRALIEADLGTSGDLYRWFSAVIEDPADPAAMLLTVKQGAPYHRLTLTHSAAGTATIRPDDVFPVCAVTSNARSHDAEARTELAISFIPVDGDGLPIENDTACTVDVEVVRVVERHAYYETTNAVPLPVGVTSSLEDTGHDINDEVRVPWDGGRFTVALSALTNPPTGIDALEIHYRLVQA